jgi:hypothetical protein
MLWNSFGTKSIGAHFRAVTHFMCKHKYMYCQNTSKNKATRVPQGVLDGAREFLELTHPLLLGPHCNWHWIFNMDQTPIHLSYHSSKTLVKHGLKTTHMRMTSNGTNWATGALTMTAASNFLTPMKIFKG